jgi:adenosylcobinamide kinase/adenosylcobinamide-phosphate guanylyltransferase
MTRNLILVLGGARGGKSEFADGLAAQLGERVLYVATAQPGDDEMRRRIANHRGSRPGNWTTLEAATGVGAAVVAALRDHPPEVVLLDCLTLLVSNVVLGDLPDGDPDLVDEAEARLAVSAELDELLAAYSAGKASWIVVTNEVGWGLVPPYALGRVYRDLLGWANQRLAQVADRVYLLVAGLPIDVKALAVPLPF